MAPPVITLCTNITSREKPLKSSPRKNRHNDHALCTTISEIDECQSNPCQNGGVCTDAVGLFNCECLSGYEGDMCETGNLPSDLITCQ